MRATDAREPVVRARPFFCALSARVSAVSPVKLRRARQWVPPKLPPRQPSPARLGSK